jgi:hypothetical protein
VAPIQEFPEEKWDLMIGVKQIALGDPVLILLAERAPQAEIRPGGRKVRFETLLQAVAMVHVCGRKELLAAGRSARYPSRARNLRIWRVNGVR